MNLHLILASLTATLSLGIAAQAAPAKVACVGDSITFGTGRRNTVSASARHTHGAGL